MGEDVLEQPGDLLRGAGRYGDLVVKEGDSICMGLLCSAIRVAVCLSASDTICSAARCSVGVSHDEDARQNIN